MMKGQYQIVCCDCGHIEQSNAAIKCSKCGGTVSCKFDLSNSEKLVSEIQNAKCFWDYRSFFPVDGGHPVTLGEGNTPLICAEHLRQILDVGQLFLKNEAQNPTGTFKDRCMSIAFTKALECGAEAVVLGSAGNAGAAAAAYASAAGIPCYLFVPGASSMERIAQSIAYSARIIMVDGGGVTDCIELIEAVQEKYNWVNVTTAYPCNPFQGESEKTIAYEIAKQMDFQVPDWVIVPIGGGGCLTGIYKGFRDLLELKLITRIPKMIGVQEEGCCAVVKAFEKNALPQDIEREEKISGIAVPIMDAYPLDGAFALKAIYESGGLAVAVSSDELVKAYLQISSKEGIFSEIASAATVAAVAKLRERQVIQSNDSVICVITGSGLKDSAAVLRYKDSTARCKADKTELESVISRFGS